MGQPSQVWSVCPIFLAAGAFETSATRKAFALTAVQQGSFIRADFVLGVGPGRQIIGP